MQIKYAVIMRWRERAQDVYKRASPRADVVCHAHKMVLALPEINTVRADMTRTSLVDGISPFCFTCANNIRLVCGKGKETMALRVATSTTTTPAKRQRHPPGYYRALHNCSSADVLDVGTGDRNREDGKLRLRADSDLPEGCYEVERLVAKRRRKVLATVILMCLCIQ